jgi:hypothetical protein
MPANSQRIGVIRSFDDQTTEIMQIAQGSDGNHDARFAAAEYGH